MKIWKINCQIQFSLNQLANEDLTAVRSENKRSKRKELEDLWPIICLVSRRLNLLSLRKSFELKREHNSWRLTKSQFIKLLFWCLSLSKAQKRDRQELLWKTLQNINHNCYFCLPRLEKYFHGLQHNWKISFIHSPSPLLYHNLKSFFVSIILLRPPPPVRRQSCPQISPKWKLCCLGDCTEFTWHDNKKW